MVQGFSSGLALLVLLLHVGLVQPLNPIPIINVGIGPNFLKLIILIKIY